MLVFRGVLSGVLAYLFTYKNMSSLWFFGVDSLEITDHMVTYALCMFPNIMITYDYTCTTVKIHNIWYTCKCIYNIYIYKRIVTEAIGYLRDASPIQDSHSMFEVSLQPSLSTSEASSLNNQTIKLCNSKVLSNVSVGMKKFESQKGLWKMGAHFLLDHS